MKTGFHLHLLVTVLAVLFLFACELTPPLPIPNLLDKHNGYWKGTAWDMDGTPRACPTP